MNSKQMNPKCIEIFQYIKYNINGLENALFWDVIKIAIILFQKYFG